MNEDPNAGKLSNVLVKMLFSHNRSSVVFAPVSDLLESNQFDVNCCDEKQRTCLHIASSRGNSTIVRLLLQHGANPNIKDCVNNLPIHVAIIASHVEVVTVSAAPHLVTLAFLFVAFC